MALVHAASIVGFSLGLALIIDGVIAGSGWESLNGASLLFLASAVLRGLTHALLGALAQSGGARVKSQLRHRGLASLHKLGPGRLSAHTSVSATTLLSQGVDALDAYFGRYLPQLMLASIQTPVLLAVLWVTDIPTGLAITIVLPIIPVFMVLIGLVTRSIQKRQWEALRELGEAFVEIVDGLSTLKIFGRHWRQVARIREVTDNFRKKTMAVLRVSFLSSFVLELAASLSVAIVAVSIGIRLISGDLPLWLGLFVLVLVPDVFLPLRQVGAQFHQAADGLAAAEELFALYQEADSVDNLITPIAANDVTPDMVRLNGVYPVRGSRGVTSPISFEIAPGAITVISGPSGVGKTSLLMALLGFVDLDGDITVGRGASGRGELPLRLSWAPQNPGLGQGTVASAITGPGPVDHGVLDRVVTLAGLGGLNMSMILGVEGAGLSGGQAQRVGLARAFYRLLTTPAHILLLDEPTSALDKERESEVLASIETLVKEGNSAVVVSHRQLAFTLPVQRVTLTPSEIGEEVTQ